MLAARRSDAARSAALAILALALAAPTPAEEPPDLSGVWQLPEQAQEDLEAQVDAAVGSEKSMGGGSDKAKFTLLGRGGSSNEIDRVQLRSFLLEQVVSYGDLEIEQKPDEITLSRGNDSLRIFSFTRERTRESGFGGMTKTRARWQGGQLILEEEGDDLKLVEALTLLPDGTRLTHAVRLEAKGLAEPLSLRLMYNRVGESEE